MSIREPPNYLPTEATEPTEVSGARYSPTDCTDIHRLGGGRVKTPTDCTDVHRLGGYGIPAIPTQPQNYLPTEFTEHTETTGGEENLCTSVKSVGGSSPPEASVYSVKSVGEYPPPETSVNSVNSVGEYPPPEASVNSEFCGRTCANKLGVGSVEGMRRAAWVWHPCHTHAATKLSSHRIHGTHRNNWRRRKNLCTSVKSVGGSSPPETSVSICEIRGRISSA